MSSSSTAGINLFVHPRDWRRSKLCTERWSGLNTGSICFICSSRKNTHPLSTKLKIKSCYWHSCFEIRLIKPSQCCKVRLLKYSFEVLVLYLRIYIFCCLILLLHLHFRETVLFTSLHLSDCLSYYVDYAPCKHCKLFQVICVDYWVLKVLFS